MSPRANKSAIALKTARRYARKAEGGADLEPPSTEGLKRVYISTTGLEDREASPWGLPQMPWPSRTQPRQELAPVNPPISDAPTDYQPEPGAMQPRRGPLDRALAGVRKAYTEGGDFGISGENLTKYPGLLPLQPVAAGADAALRTISGAIHGVAGLAGGVAEDVGGPAKGDRMERDVNIMGQVAMPELASPLGIHSIPSAAKKAMAQADTLHDPNSASMAPAVAPKPKVKEFFHPYDLDPNELKGAKQIGPQSGSNPGGLYELSSGEPVYIKTPQSHEHTYNEKLAAELYQLAGVPVASVKMTKFKGKPSIASPIVPGDTLSKFHPDEWGGVKGIQENYPVDLWLGNYDFVGTGKDNIIVDPHGNAWRIDMGGALRFRAQGLPKGPDMWGPEVKHFDLKKSPDIGDVIDPYKMDVEYPAAKRVAEITDDQIKALVDKYGPLTKGEKPKLVETLIKRRDAIAEMYDVKKGRSSDPSGDHGSGMPADMDDFFAKMEQEMLGQASESKDNVVPFKLEQQIPFNPDPQPDLYDFKNNVLKDPKQAKQAADGLYEQYNGDPEAIAKELAWKQKHFGKEYADAIGSKLPESIRHDVGNHLDKLEYEAKIKRDKSYDDQSEYAYDDDMAPHMDEGYYTTGQHDTYGGNPILKYKPEQVKEWAAIDPLPATYNKNVDFYRDLIKRSNEPGNVIKRIHNFEDWIPPIQEELVAPKTPNISPAKLRGLLFNPNFELYKGGYHEYSTQYPNEIIDPRKKGGHEEAFFLGDTTHVAKGYGAVGLPYVLRAKNAVEVYLPHLTGEIYDAKYKPSSLTEAEAFRVQKMGATYTGNIFDKLIRAGHAEKIDLIIVHGISDNGAYNHTQYMLLDTRGNIRGLTANFDPEHIHPSSPKSRSPLAGIVGGTPFIYGVLKNQQEDKDKKMARGGRTKFKSYSSVDVKSRRMPKTVVHTGRAAKALRTAKKLATGGPVDDPQEHHFISFKKGGMIDSDIPGRTDEIPMKVTSGAYVLPADIPSALGQGNTMAGKSILDNMFGGSDSPQMADGGEVDDHVPIIAAGGEYIIHPNKVKEIGHGDMSKGHKVLDKFVLHTRAEHIKTLKKLKPPK